LTPTGKSEINIQTQRKREKSLLSQEKEGETRGRRKEREERKEIFSFSQRREEREEGEERLVLSVFSSAAQDQQTKKTCLERKSTAYKPS